MKSIVVLIPGLFDVAHKSLNGATSIEKANCEALDEIAQMGQWIRVRPPKGGLEHSLLELFGLESSKTHLSISSLEIYSKSYPFKPNQCAFLFKFISQYENQVVDLDSSFLKQEELNLFCKDLNETFDSWIHFIPLKDSSGVCLIKEPFDQTLSYSLPQEMMGKNYLDLLHPYFKKNRRQEKIAALLEFLDQHALNLVRRDFEEQVCNGLLFFEGGAPLNAITSRAFYERFWLYSPKSSSRGLANLLSIHNLEIQKGNNFEYLDHLMGQVNHALDQHQTLFLEHHEILESTLKGNLLEKIKRIEYLDRNLLKPLMHLCQEREVQLIVTPFKQTDITQKSLVNGDVPWIIYNPKHKKSIEPILSFREKEFERIKGNFTIRGLASQFLY